jgi:ribosomal protein S30
MREDELWVGLEVSYADAAVIEWALVDFVDDARKQIGKLQAKEGKDTPRRKELINIYQRRIKRGKAVLGLVSAAMNEVADDLMVEDMVEAGDD